MKTKRVWASVLAACMALTCFAACDLDEEYEDYAEEEIEETSDNVNTVSDKSKTVSPMQITVDQNTGNAEITRPESAEIPMADDGSWTIFVYLCGADLESEYGSASGDMQEMCYADASDKVRFVVETGGANRWQNDFASSDTLGRYLIQNNDIIAIDEVSGASMGDAATLADFLNWGVKEYPAEHMGVILWNHGGGSITGVCFDELNGDDSLTMRELDSAFYSVFENMTDRFEFVGFDACMMGTVEGANILASYARYMVGSQELEPGNGWDYTVIGDYLAANPGCNGAELGKVIADGFYESCKLTSEEKDATLSVIDLDKVDDMVKAFNVFAKGMYEASADTTVLANVIREIEAADNFGGNNRSEGYTNMVDLGGLITACSDYVDITGVMSAIDSAVVYNKTGSTHTGCSGLSIYYPLSVGGSKELSVMEDITISPFYSSFIDRQDFSSSIYYDPSSESDDTYYDEETGYYYFTEGDALYCYDENSGECWLYDYNSDEWIQVEIQYDYGSYDYGNSNDDFGYSDDYWFGDDCCWYSSCEMEYDDNAGCYRSRSVKNDHWDYTDNIEQTGESPYIQFLKEPVINDEGTYSFTLTPKSVDRTASVSAFVYQVIDDEALLLGETIDVYCDWDNGHFEDGFDGYWLSLPDGQNLSTSIVAVTEQYTVYSSPILLNGVETNLRFKLFYDDYSIEVEGAWDGIDQSGAAAKQIKKIVAGDKIVPLYSSISLKENDDTESLWSGQEYVVDGAFEIVYALLDESDYLYAFCIDDIYNDFYLTDFIEFAVDADGNTYFYIYE